MDRWVIAYLSFLYIHNVYLNPFCTYPWPTPFAAFCCPYIYKRTRQLPLRIMELHDTYGPATRISPDELSCAITAARRDIDALRPGNGE